MRTHQWHDGDLSSSCLCRSEVSKVSCIIQTRYYFLIEVPQYYITFSHVMRTSCSFFRINSSIWRDRGMRRVDVPTTKTRLLFPCIQCIPWLKLFCHKTVRPICDTLANQKTPTSCPNNFSTHSLSAGQKSISFI